MQYEEQDADSNMSEGLKGLIVFVGISSLAVR